jgi:hypothetical protein
MVEPVKHSRYPSLRWTDSVSATNSQFAIAGKPFAVVCANEAKYDLGHADARPISRNEGGMAFPR